MSDTMWGRHQTGQGKASTPTVRAEIRHSFLAFETTESEELLRASHILITGRAEMRKGVGQAPEGGQGRDESFPAWDTSSYSQPLGPTEGAVGKEGQGSVRDGTLPWTSLCCLVPTGGERIVTLAPDTQSSLCASPSSPSLASDTSRLQPSIVSHSPTQAVCGW